jgi:hypothetical protein
LEFFVVLGSILLAFGLERLYEEYLDNKYVDELLIDVSNEVMYDYNQASVRLAVTDQRIRELDGFFDNREITQEGILYNLPIYSILLSRGAYDEWIRFSEEMPEKYDSLNTILIQIKNRYSWKFLNSIDQRETLVYEYKRYLRDKDWFLEIGMGKRLSDEGDEFILNDIASNNFLYEYAQIIHELDLFYCSFRSLSLQALFEFRRNYDDPKEIEQYLHPNHRVLPDDSKQNFQGAYFSKPDSNYYLEYSFTEGYLTEKSSFGGYDFYYSVNDSTFQSLVGCSTLKFRLENDHAVAFQASYQHSSNVDQFVKFEQ